MNPMCTWFYADKATLSPIITRAQQLPLADTIRNTMSRSAEMSGNIRPTDMAAVFAPNKQGNMAVFPMIWSFTVERSSKPLINCRIETVDRKPVWKDSWFRRRCVIPASWYYEWGIPPSEVGYHNANEQRNIKKEYSRKGLRSHTSQDYTASRSIEVSGYRCLQS